MESLVTRNTLSDFYKGKRVFVTGHTGFKGIWLVAILKQMGAIVKGYALAPEDSKPFYDLFAPGLPAESIIADIRDAEKLSAEVNSFQPDIIFHLAAQALVLRSYEMPAATFDINVTGTANLLHALRTLEKKCSTVVVTTDKVYENKEKDILYKEDDTLGGYDPYSASKACTEIVVSSFRNSFFNTNTYDTHNKAIASARAGNVIGGGDWSTNRIIPDTARALLQDKPIIVRNPASVRPWQHVLEPLSGYLLLGANLYNQPLLFSKPFNFGPYPEDHLNVKELVDIAIKVWGKGTMQSPENNTQPHEAGILQLDINRAIKELNWQPRLTAKQAIEWTIGWYKTNTSAQADMTIKQIHNYFSA